MGHTGPAEIPAMLDAYTRSMADLVIGYRDFRAMPPARRAANVLAAGLSAGLSAERCGTTSPAIGS